MRLLILTSQVSPYHNARYVGATQYFEDVHVVSTVNAGAFPEFIAKSLGKYVLHRLYEGQEAYVAAAASKELTCRIRKVLEEIRPDFIAAAGWATPESLAALEYGRDYKVPTILMSESQIDDAPRSYLREVLKRRIVTQFDAALVGGPPHAEYVGRLGISSDKLHYGYNAVDNAYFEREADAARSNADTLKTRYGLPERYILASARMIKKKNLPNLIAAYADARCKQEDLPSLVVLGDGPERTAVEDAIRFKNIEGFVHLPGFRGYEMLPAYYALSEGFLHVSTAEQWGLVINEAMASGVPVIASRPCGAARSVIQDGVTGLLTDVDAASISDAISRLFAMPPEARAEMGLAGRKEIGFWGPDRFGSGLEAAVDSARKTRRRGRIQPWDRVIINRLQRKIIDTVA